MPEPGSSDWLANHEEPGQSFEQFVSGAANVPTAERGVIYIASVTLSDPDTGQTYEVPSSVIALLADYAAIFFAMPVRVLHIGSLDGRVRTRVHQVCISCLSCVTYQVMLRLEIVRLGFRLCKECQTVPIRSTPTDDSLDTHLYSLVHSEYVDCKH